MPENELQSKDETLSSIPAAEPKKKAAAKKSSPSEKVEPSDTVATAITTPAEPSAISTLAPVEIINGNIIFNQKHLQIIREQIAANATDEEFELFIMMARRMRLDPLVRQIYLIKYGNNAPAYVASIDAYRIVAHRTGLFAGIDEPMFSYDNNGKITHCAVTVFKMVDHEKCGFSAKVKFSEYNTGKNQWSSKPETMIAKVAEAHALRKAFPQDLAGVYTAEEMEQAAPSIDGNTGKVQQAPKVAMITKKEAQSIFRLMGEKGKSKADLEAFMEKKFNTKDLRKLTLTQANAVIAKLKTMPDIEMLDEEEDDTYVPEPEGEPQDSGLDIDDIDEGIKKMNYEATADIQFRD